MYSTMLFCVSGKKPKSALVGDSDDDNQPNTYDYNDSFIDDNGKD